MKTKVEIDRALLKQARKALKTVTIQETINASLRSVVRKGQLRVFADALGKIPLDLTVGRVRHQRAKRMVDVRH